MSKPKPKAKTGVPLPTLKDIEKAHPHMVILVGWDRCIVGVVESFGGVSTLCYDADLILEGLREQGMTSDEAVEFFEYNIAGGYYGARTPAFLFRIQPPKKPTKARPKKKAL